MRIQQVTGTMGTNVENFKDSVEHFWWSMMVLQNFKYNFYLLFQKTLQDKTCY